MWLNQSFVNVLNVLASLASPTLLPTSKKYPSVFFLAPQFWAVSFCTVWEISRSIHGVKPHDWEWSKKVASYSPDHTEHLTQWELCQKIHPRHFGELGISCRLTLWECYLSHVVPTLPSTLAAGLRSRSDTRATTKEKPGSELGLRLWMRTSVFVLWSRGHEKEM